MNFVAAAAISILGLFWLYIRRKRCCGGPDTCPHMQRGSPYLDRVFSSGDPSPACPHALPTVAMHFHRQGATGYALAAAARAARAGNPAAYLVLARIHSDLGNGRLARELFRGAIARDENSLAAWLGLGEHFSAAGEFQNALLHFRRAAEADPSFAEAWCALGRCHAALDQWADARASFEVALRRNPEHLPTMHALGLAMVGSGDLLSALAVFERIMSIAGPSGALLARLGRLAREAGDYRRSVVYLREAMKLSALPDLKRDMAEIYEAMGQSEIAEFYRQEYEKEYVI